MFRNTHLFSQYGVYRKGEFCLKAPNKFDSCKGAARIHHKKDTFRWIFADENGHYRWADLQETLERTTHLDDWNTLRQKHIQGADRKELRTVREHFADLYCLDAINEQEFQSIDKELSLLLDP